jgi:hypothetical protein
MVPSSDALAGGVGAAMANGDRGGDGGSASDIEFVEIYQRGLERKPEAGGVSTTAGRVVDMGLMPPVRALAREFERPYELRIDVDDPAFEPLDLDGLASVLTSIGGSVEVRASGSHVTITAIVAVPPGEAS